MKLFRVNDFIKKINEEELPNDLNGPVDTTYKNSANTYMKEAIKLIEVKLQNIFDGESEGVTDMQLEDIKTMSMPLTERLILKFSDSMYLYDLVFSIHLNEVVDNMDEDFDSSKIENVGVRFKKYDRDDNLLGQLDKKKIKMEEISEDLFSILNQELDEKFNLDSGELEIEFED